MVNEPLEEVGVFSHTIPTFTNSDDNVMTQLWHSNVEGIPTRLKNTRKMNLESAIETSNELLGNGWELVEQKLIRMLLRFVHVHSRKVVYISRIIT